MVLAGGGGLLRTGGGGSGPGAFYTVRSGRRSGCLGDLADWWNVMLRLVYLFVGRPCCV